MKLTEADISAVLDDCKAALEKVRLDDFEKEQLFTSYSKMLTEYRDHFGEDTEIRYRIRKRLVRLELVLSVKGENGIPFSKNAMQRLWKYKTKSILFPLAEPRQHPAIIWEDTMSLFSSQTCRYPSADK